MTEERQLSDRRVVLARPTIRVNGRAHQRTSELLLTMAMVEQEGGMSALQLRFSNWCKEQNRPADFAFEDESLLRLGALISVYTGDESAPQELFRGKLTGFELELSHTAPPELVVFAEDALQRARMSRKTELHPNVSLAELARSVAKDAGLTPQVVGFTDTIGPQLQLNESNLAFLRRLLTRYDGDLQVVGDELHVSPRADVQRDTLTLLSSGQLSRLRLTADIAHQVSEVTVTGWDAERARKLSCTSQGRALGPGRGRTGAQLLEDVLGKCRSEHVGHHSVLTDAEARMVADAEFDQRARRFVLLEGTTDGNSTVRVGSHITLEDVSPRFNNTYYVVQACHRYDQVHGYLTDFEAECAYLGDA